MKTINDKSKYNIAYRGKMFEVITWEPKPGVTFEVAVRAPGVRLIIETEKQGSKALLMSREIRYEQAGPVTDYRLPGGKVFDRLDDLNTHRESGDDILPIAKNAAQKEAFEEVGVTGGIYEFLETTTAGTSVEWDLHYFKVTNAEIGEQNLEEHEQGDIEMVTLSPFEIFEKLKNREIREGRSADMLWCWLVENGFVGFKE